MSTPRDDLALDIVQRTVLHNGQPYPCHGVSVESLIRILKECPKESVVMFAVAMPTGKTLWAGVHGVIADYDGSGACTVLADLNIMRMVQGTP